MMANNVTQDSPLSQALQNAIQPKLVELSWSSGLDDTTLTEYIVLMLVNSKTQEQISKELSTDLLDLPADDPAPASFSKWLFEQVETLSKEQDTSAAGAGEKSHEQLMKEQADIISATEQDAEMADSGEGADEAQTSVPTGPKAMRKGGQNPRDARGQINRHLDRNGDSALHRVRDRGGTGRVNSHSREPPKGRRSVPNQAMNFANGMNMNIAGQPMMFGNAGGAGMSPQNFQANMFAQFGQWAQQMSQQPPEVQAQFFASQGMNSPLMNSSPRSQSFGQRGGSRSQRGGRSLLDRTERPLKGKAGADSKSQHDTDMGDASNENGSSTTNNHGEDGAERDPFSVVCRFNHSCSKADCPYAHQTPASHTPVTIDLADTCTHGVACKNFKCVARHPSPAKKAAHHAEENCKYWPNCTNPRCPFKHVPMCRNGADCATPDCKFTHVKMQCKFNPCLNKACQFKHSEGQARGAFADKVWTAGGEKNEHVSDRKFVIEGGDEELIIPANSSSQEDAAITETVMT